MSNCDLLVSCYFYKKELSGMPCTFKHMMNKYCCGEYAQCARFVYARVYGRNSVPLEMFPNDPIATVSTNQFEAGETQGGMGMQIKVIYPDGTSDMVRAGTIDGLIKNGKIIAFLCSEGWVEVRRKSTTSFNGVDRRRTPSKNYFGGF